MYEITAKLKLYRAAISLCDADKQFIQTRGFRFGHVVYVCTNAQENVGTKVRQLKQK